MNKNIFWLAIMYAFKIGFGLHCQVFKKQATICKCLIIDMQSKYFKNFEEYHEKWSKWRDMQGFDLIISKSSQRTHKENKEYYVLVTCKSKMRMKAVIFLGPAKVLITCV